MTSIGVRCQGNWAPRQRAGLLCGMRGMAGSMVAQGLGVCLALATVAGPTLAAQPGTAAADGRTLTSNGYTVVLSDTGGSLRVTAPDGAPIAWSGGDGLWAVEFADGSRLTAAQAGRPTARTDPDGSLRISYDHPDVRVTVSVLSGPAGVDLAATVTLTAKTVLGFAFPATLRFDSPRLRRFISPMNGNESTGAAFLRPFFEEQSADRPTGWAPEARGPAGYVQLFGAPLTQRPDADPPVPLAVTPLGREWLGEAAAKLEGARACVNRPSAPGQADTVLVDSSNGPWLSGAGLGGRGLLLRVGGAVGAGEASLSLTAVVAALEHVGRGPRSERTTPTIVVLRVPNGPLRGSWCDVPIAQWAEGLRSSAALRDAGITIEEESSPTAVLDRLASEAGPPLAVLNPYGEALPLAPGVEMNDAVGRIGAYVRGGGTWVEVGGWPFFYALRPRTWLSYSTSYPAGFADFQHLETEGGSLSIYRVAPRTHGPWEARGDLGRAFVPGELGHGRDEGGPFCRRVFHPFVAAGTEWVSPTVRLSFGRDPLSALRAYAAANALVRPLAEKMDAERLSRLRKSVLIYCGGTARELLGALDSLPSPCVLHTADYLKGGFDKQYPDHLPPRPGFGTEDDLRTLVRECGARGIIFCPYTNPTWWCDHPRGPTFERCGETPLARDLSGKPYHEIYGANDGWTTTFWHPDVQAANRETVRQFTEEFPVGLLFQDQCGARGWTWDTNPASPSPSAYTEGLVSMVQEDSARAPLSTEGGWDQLLPYESQFCGMTWALVPTEFAPSWITLLRDRYPGGTWEPFPVAQAIGHESVAMIHHDLGQFVTNPEVLAWTLGIGFGIGYRMGASAVAELRTREWLHWIDAIQKSVCARYIGVRLDEFEVLRDGAAAEGGTPLLHTRYGGMDVVANTMGSPRAIPGRDGIVLAAYGFDVRAPGLRAGGIDELDGHALADGGAWFVCESGPNEATVSLYAVPGAAVRLPLPEGWTTVSAAVCAGTEVEVRVGDGLIGPVAPIAGAAEQAPRHVYEIHLTR